MFELNLSHIKRFEIKKNIIINAAWNIYLFKYFESPINFYYFIIHIIVLITFIKVSRT